MDIVPILSTIILIATIATLIIAVSAYAIFRMKEKRGRSAPPADNKPRVFSKEAPAESFGQPYGAETVRTGPSGAIALREQTHQPDHPGAPARDNPSVIVVNTATPQASAPPPQQPVNPYAPPQQTTPPPQQPANPYTQPSVPQGQPSPPTQPSTQQPQPTPNVRRETADPNLSKAASAFVSSLRGAGVKVQVPQDSSHEQTDPSNQPTEPMMRRFRVPKKDSQDQDNSDYDDDSTMWK